MEPDQLYLAKIQDYYADHGVIPPYSTLMTITGLKSKNSISGMVARLKLAGFLAATPDKRLKPGTRFFDRPLFDSVRAGLPSMAGDLRHDYVAIDEYLISHPSSTVLVTVKGDSMIDAGIMPDDVVVVEKRGGANVGDMVIAIIDNEFTLKTLGKENGRFILIPANKAYPTIRPQGDFEIFGIVVGQFRKYK